MPSKCTFSFDRPNPVYYSGETIKGHISLSTKSEKIVRGVHILFEGVAKVRWKEIRSRTANVRTEHYTVYYSGNETYVNTQTRVFGEGTLPPGKHKYTFNIPLPPQCPTSCTEEYGSISYEISLKLNRQYRFDNVFTQRLTVIKQRNLNQRPEYLLPMAAEDIKYFCFWPCSSGPVITTLTIPFSGWAPGQKIPYKIEIDNQSHGYDLKCTQLKLKQTYHFTAHSPERETRTRTNCLTRLKQENPAVLRLSKRIFEGKLRIPPVPPSSSGGGIITVSYRIEMDIQTGDCQSNSEIWIPITIGTIPLIQSATNLEHIIALSPTLDSADRPPSYDICMPPTFEEATYIGKQFKDIDKDEYQNKSFEGWLPQYPTYNDFAVSTAESAPTTNNNEECNGTKSQSLLSLGLPSSANS